MTSRPAVIVIDAARPRLVADFWRAVLGWEVVESDADGISVAPGDGSWPGIDVFQVPEGKSIKNRLHLDLRADGSSTEDELQRLLNLGARRGDVGQGPEVSWVVLADPAGNEFCLLSRTVQEMSREETSRRAHRPDAGPLSASPSRRSGNPQAHPATRQP